VNAPLEEGAWLEAAGETSVALTSSVVPASFALRARASVEDRNLRKLKQRFGGKTIRDIRFRVG